MAHRPRTQHFLEDNSGGNPGDTEQGDDIPQEETPPNSSYEAGIPLTKGRQGRYGLRFLINTDAKLLNRMFAN